MSNLDDKLERLLKAASRAQQSRPSEIPYGFETRVLAAWAAMPEAVSMVAFFQRAFLACLALMVISLIFSYGNWNTSASNPLFAMTDSASSLVDSAVDVSVP